MGEPGVELCEGIEVELGAFEAAFGVLFRLRIDLAVCRRDFMRFGLAIALERAIGRRGKLGRWGKVLVTMWIWR